MRETSTSHPPTLCPSIPNREICLFLVARMQEATSIIFGNFLLKTDHTASKTYALSKLKLIHTSSESYKKIRLFFSSIIHPKAAAWSSI